MSVKLHRESVTDCCTSQDGSVLYTVSQDSCLRAYSLQEQRQLRMTSFNLALSGCKIAPDNKSLVLSSWDNNLYLYSVEFGRVSETIPAHDDAVSCVQILGEQVISGSWDSTVRLWQFRAGSISHTATAVLLEGDAGISCVELSARPNAAISGSIDGALVLYDLRAYAPCATVMAHTDSIKRVMFGAAAKIVSISDDGHFKVWDARKFSSEGTTAIFDVELSSKPTSLLLDVPSNTAFVGTETGTVELWDITGSSGASPCCVLPSRDGSHQPITAICSSENQKAGTRDTIIGDGNGTICLFKSRLIQ